MTTAQLDARRATGRQLVILDDHNTFHQYQQEWLALERAATEPVFFQSYAWCGHIAENQTQYFADSFRPFVCVGINDGEVTAIWPLCRRRSMGMWSLHNLDEPFGQFAGLIARDDIEAEALVKQTLEHARKKRLADTAKFERVHLASHLHAALVGLGGIATDEVGAPYIDLSPFETFKQYQETRNKKTLKNLRNALNRLARTGTASTTVCRQQLELGKLITRSLENRTAWLSANGLTSPSFRNPGHHDALLGGQNWNLGDSRIGFDLQRDGISIAQQWGFIHNDRYYAYMSGSNINAAGATVSIGGVQLAGVIEACFDLNIKTIEFLTPASPYKMTWTKDTHELVNISVSISSIGKVRSALYDRGLRPLVKAGFHHLPPGLRRRLVH